MIELAWGSLFGHLTVIALSSGYEKGMWKGEGQSGSCRMGLIGDKASWS